jgi:hypothetical protein
VFRENRRTASSQAVVGVCSTVRVKSILGIDPRVKESIKKKNPSGGRSGWEAFTMGFMSELKA